MSPSITPLPPQPVCQEFILGGSPACRGELSPLVHSKSALGLFEQPRPGRQRQALLLDSPHQLDRNLLLLRHIIQCRHHGTFPAKHRSARQVETPLDPQFAMRRNLPEKAAGVDSGNDAQGCIEGMGAAETVTSRVARGQGNGESDGFDCWLQRFRKSSAGCLMPWRSARTCGLASKYSCT